MRLTVPFTDFDVSLNAAGWITLDPKNAAGERELFEAAMAILADTKAIVAFGNMTVQFEKDGDAPGFLAPA